MPPSRSERLPAPSPRAAEPRRARHSLTRPARHSRSVPSDSPGPALRRAAPGPSARRAAAAPGPCPPSSSLRFTFPSAQLGSPLPGSSGSAGHARRPHDRRGGGGGRCRAGRDGSAPAALGVRCASQSPAWAKLNLSYLPGRWESLLGRQKLLSSYFLDGERTFSRISRGEGTALIPILHPFHGK